jgi:hypothetical protein
MKHICVWRSTYTQGIHLRITTTVMLLAHAEICVRYYQEPFGSLHSVTLYVAEWTLGFRNLFMNKCKNELG